MSSAELQAAAEALLSGTKPVKMSRVAPGVEPDTPLNTPQTASGFLAGSINTSTGMPDVLGARAAAEALMAGSKPMKMGRVAPGLEPDTPLNTPQTSSGFLSGTPGANPSVLRPGAEVDTAQAAAKALLAGGASARSSVPSASASKPMTIGGGGVAQPELVTPQNTPLAGGAGLLSSSVNTSTDVPGGVKLSAFSPGLAGALDGETPQNTPQTAPSFLTSGMLGSGSHDAIAAAIQAKLSGSSKPQAQEGGANADSTDLAAALRAKLSGLGDAADDDKAVSKAQAGDGDGGDSGDDDDDGDEDEEGDPFEMYLSLLASLPPHVRRRVAALKNLDDESEQVDMQFKQEMRELERKYHDLAAPIYAARADIISGAHEPSEEEYSRLDAAERAALEREDSPEQAEQAKAFVGVPQFWLKVLLASPMLRETIEEADQAALMFLVDINVELFDQHSFALHFRFAENPFFSNQVLTKRYFLGDEDGELLLERAEGTEINWHPGQSLTTKMVRLPKKQRSKRLGTTTTLLRESRSDSFFNFFTPPSVPTPEEGVELTPELAMELESAAEADLMMGSLLREKVIPRAWLFFTGEAQFDEDEFDDDDD